MTRQSGTPQHSGRSTPSTFSTTTDRTWTTSMSSYQGSHYTFESNNNRPSWKFAQPMSPPPAPRERADSKPSRLKISPSHSSSSVVKSASSHGKLHKRGSSASSLTHTPLSAFPAYDGSYDSVISPPAMAYQDAKTSQSSVASNSRVLIKPLLRKLSNQEKGSLDLSRSAAENEGLGIYTSSSSRREHRGGSDVGYGSGRVGFHTRTMSGNSQVSTATTSSNNRPGAQYVHPMRQLPQPPIAHSYQNSMSSELSRPTITSDDTLHYPHPSAPYSASHTTIPVPPPTLHIRTHSSSRVTSSSQVNLPGTPSSLRYADNIPPDSAMAPHSRSSFDSVFRKRSRTNTANTLNDPVAQFAAVSALRAEFNAREAAKELKLEQAQARVEEREARRREKRDESIRRKSETRDRKRAKSNAGSEKSAPMSAIDYASTHAFPVTEDADLSLGSMQQERPKRKRTTTVSSAGKAGKAVSSRWSLFWFQFRTLLLRFKRNMRGGLP